jgi:hypothetical protein
LPAALMVALLAFSVFRGCGKKTREYDWIQLEYAIHYAAGGLNAARNAAALSDGDPATFYDGAPVEKGAANVIILDLGQSASKLNVARIDYTPRQDGGAAGRAARFRVYFLRSAQTNNGKKYDGTGIAQNPDFSLAGQGRFDPDSNETQSAHLHPYTGQLMAIEFLPSSTNGGTFSAAELKIYSAPPDIGAPDTDYGKQAAELNALKRLPSEKNPQALQELTEELRAQIGDSTVEFNKNSKEEQAWLLARLQQLRATAENVGKLENLPNGGVWLDTTGAPIRALGGSVHYDAAAQRYYWYGADASQKNLLGTDKYQSVGVRCYSSVDLCNWRPEGLVLPVFNNPELVDGRASDAATPLYADETTDAFTKSPLRRFDPGAHSFPVNGTVRSPKNSLAGNVSAEQLGDLNALYAGLNATQKKQLYLSFNWQKSIQRTQISFHPATKQYVLWMLLEDFSTPRAGNTSARTTLAAATAFAPGGPFRYVGQTPITLEGLPCNLTDFTFYTDDAGKASLVAMLQPQAENLSVGAYVLPLDASWTALAEPEKPEKPLWQYLPGLGELRAPVVFRCEDTLVMLGNKSGAAPSATSYYLAKGDLTGEWQTRGALAQNDPLNDTFRSVLRAVVPARDAQGKPLSGQFYCLADIPEAYDMRKSGYALLPLEIDKNGKAILRWEDTAPPDYAEAAITPLHIVLICAGVLIAGAAVTLGLLLLRKKRHPALSKEPEDNDDEA